MFRSWTMVFCSAVALNAVGTTSAHAQAATTSVAESPRTTRAMANGHADDPTCPFKEQTGNGRFTPPSEIRNGTEMVGIFPCWDADEDNDKYNELSDFYSHWSVRELRLAPPVQRDYKSESSSPFVRLFVGKDVSMVGSLRIDLHDPDTTFVIPLATFSYQGLVGKGQTWSTNLVSDDQTLNFFRIGPTTSAKISVTAKSTSTLQVQAASKVLGVLSDLATIASPGGALVTSLNRDSIQQTSRTLDNALSSIWGQSTEESHASARQLSEWYPNARFIIQLTMPKFVKGQRPSVADGAKGERPLLTRWYELSLSCPRRSIFISIVECNNRSPAAAAKVLEALSYRISAQQVLNLKVQGGVSLQQFVSNHDWYSRFLRGGDTEAGNGEQQVVAAALPPPAPPVTTDAAVTAGVVATDAASPPPPPPPPPTEGEAAAAAAPKVPAVQVTPKQSVTSKRSDSDYSALCSSIVNSLYTIGLSRLDAQIGLWAIVTGSSDFVGIEPKFQSNGRCTALLPLAGTDRSSSWVFATDDKKEQPTKPTKPAKPKAGKKK